MKQPEEVQEITEEIISNIIGLKKTKKDSEGKPSQKSEEEKIIEEIINNL